MKYPCKSHLLEIGVKITELTLLDFLNLENSEPKVIITKYSNIADYKEFEEEEIKFILNEIISLSIPKETQSKTNEDGSKTPIEWALFLITHNHHNVFNYPLSLFRIAIKEVNEKITNDLIIISNANRLALLPNKDYSKQIDKLTKKDTQTELKINEDDKEFLNG